MVSPGLRVSPARLTAAAVVATLVGITLTWLPVLAQQRPGPVDTEATPEQFAACLASGAAETARSRGTGAMRFIGTHAGALPNPRRPGDRTPIETAAREYLAVCGSLFGLSGDPSELEITRATTRNRRSVLRFQQMYRGIPIFGGELVVQLDADRNVLAASGHILPRTRMATRSRVSPAAATRTAMDAIARVHDVASQDLSPTMPRLWIYSRTLLGRGEGPPQLVWRLEIASNRRLPIRELVLVDALRGNIALHFDQVETALQRETLTASNTLSLPGVVVCDESNSVCTGGDAHAEAAHAFAGDTYNFFASYIGRDGITGTGSPIRSTVHYGTGYANAFWDGAQVVYGDAFGFPLADDVVAHELAHGVTQHTANLFNVSESGAIGESLADFWGELVDQTNGRGNDEAGVRWLIGEDIAGLGAVRSMSDPAAFGQPDRMTSLLYQVGDEGRDDIHANSGVNNKAASLMVDGGTFNGLTVASLGIAKTAKIYYEAQTNLLTSSADYEDLFYALFQACNNLIGTAGIVATDCAEVRTATLAVEMNRSSIPDVTLGVSPCTTGEPLRIFSDDLESGSAAFSITTAAGTNRWSYDSPYAEFARSGQHVLFADDAPAGVSDSSVAMTAGVDVPRQAYLQFTHAYDFDGPDFDGGVVEYSVDEGVSWLDAGALFDGRAYTGAIIDGGANPLAGRSAFVGSSHGWVTSRVNLSSLAGSRVRFRWRLGLDSIGVGGGWWIDDIEIVSCPDIPPPAADTHAVAPSDLLVSDSFTGIGPLTSHTPDVNVGGGPWMVTGESPMPALSSGLVSVESGSGHLQATLEAGAADIRMGVDYRVGAGPRHLAALVFRLTDANNHLLLMFYENALHLYRRRGGGYSLLASSAAFPEPTPGTIQRLEVQTVGDQLIGLWNGLQMVQVRESFQRTATRHGVDWNSAYDSLAAFDNLEIRGIAPTPTAPPEAPQYLSPSNGAIDAALDSTLTWNGTAAATYDVALGTSNPPATVATNLTTTSYQSTLAAGTTYFWQVTARNGAGSVTGPVWSFTTSSSPEQLIVSDTFSGSDEALLASHAPDVNVPGSSWSITGGPPLAIVSAGRVGVSPGPAHVQATLLIGAVNVRMSADYHVGNHHLQLAALVFRYVDEANHLLLLFLDNGLHFIKREAGVYTLLASSAPFAAVEAGSTHRIEVRAVGAELTGSWNGTPVVQIHDDSFISGPRFGLDWDAAFDASATFDNLTIHSIGTAPSLPAVPANPSPADNASGVLPTAPLAWSASAGALEYDVQFGTSMPLPVIITGYMPAQSPSVNVAMAANTTYFWRVIARNAAGVTTGPVWSFTTATGACVDSDADRLCDLYETGSGIYVSPTNTGTSPATPDSDGDGLRDGDEVLGTAGGLDLPRLGANPNRKNILIEYDWIDDNEEAGICGAHSHRPTAAALNRLAAAFAASPVFNPDGTTGITLIQDYGQGDVFTGGNAVGHTGNIVGGLSSDFYAIKGAGLAANRSGYFHYVLMAHWYTSNPGSSGIAELGGDDVIVSLGCFGSTDNVSNTIMHELGHNLGLQHGGNQGCNWKPNYNSVMNYRFQFSGVDLSCNALGSMGEANTLDYSRGTRIQLDERNLNENAGVCGNTPIDWNFSGALESGISFDLNRSSAYPTASTGVDNNACSAALTTLTDSDDWAHISFIGIADSSGASLFHPTVDCNNPLLPRVVPEEWRLP